MPCELDSRAILAQQVAALAALGLTPVVACELEFYLLDPAADPPRPARGAVHPQVYGLAEMEALRPFLDAVNAAGDASGITVEAAISENAAGQVEVGLTHHADALRAADEAVLFKRIVRGCAALHGMMATVMAKPFAGTAGSGLHIHLSLLDRDGGNVFGAEAAEGSALLGNAIAGMAALLPDSMALFAPNRNSFRRFQPGSYAPMAPTWGVNNRTVALRIPAGPPVSRHIEHRVAGADANPYLAVAAVLAAARLGIERRLSPPAQTIGNGYDQLATPLQSVLPADWRMALERLAGSQDLQELLGPNVVDIYTTTKVHELTAYQAIVPPADYLWYMENA